VEQRVKILTNQQKESDERLTSFEKDVRASACDYYKAESETTMSGNERRRDGYERLTNNFDF